MAGFSPLSYSGRLTEESGSGVRGFVEALPAPLESG
jgi:hypothetical protein